MESERNTKEEDLETRRNRETGSERHGGRFDRSWLEKCEVRLEAVPYTPPPGLGRSAVHLELTDCPSWPCAPQNNLDQVTERAFDITNATKEDHIGRMATRVLEGSRQSDLYAEDEQNSFERWAREIRTESEREREREKKRKKERERERKKELFCACLLLMEAVYIMYRLPKSICRLTR